jgi:hypothetical protein
LSPVNLHLEGHAPSWPLRSAGIFRLPQPVNSVLTNDYFELNEGLVAAYLKIDQFMSQFVNPKKRSFLLPEGCKDLIDVLNYRDCAKGSGAELGKIILQAFESDEQLRRKLAGNVSANAMALSIAFALLTVS